MFAGEIRTVNFVGGGHCRRAPHAVLKLADIARKIALGEYIEGIGSKSQLAPVFFAEPPQEMNRQFRNILWPLPKRRQDKWNYTNAVIEVRPEFLFYYQLLKVPVRCANKAEISLERLLAANPLKLSFLKDTQELCLEGLRDLPDLIEENSAAMGQLEAALPCRDCAGERPLLVSE